jgi:hypothetical protein
MNDSKFYNLLIKKLIIRFKPRLKVSGTVAFYYFKTDNEKYVLRHNHVSGTWYLQSGVSNFDDYTYYGGYESIAKKLAKLLGYEK